VGQVSERGGHCEDSRLVTFGELVTKVAVVRVAQLQIDERGALEEHGLRNERRGQVGEQVQVGNVECIFAHDTDGVNVELFETGAIRKINESCWVTLLIHVVIHVRQVNVLECGGFGKVNLSHIERATSNVKMLELTGNLELSDQIVFEVINGE